MSYWHYSSKQEADQLKKIEVFFFKKRGYLDKGCKSGNITWSRNGEETGSVSFVTNITDSDKYLRLIYHQTDRDTGEKTDFDYKIPLVTSPCHFGGVRYWFQCPWYANGVYCWRRVGVLYLGGKYFACRHCYNLTYNCRNLSGISKLIGQVISESDLERFEAEAKRKNYRGKMTRKYKRFIRKEMKSMRQMKIIVDGLYIKK
jgi:hypothetical protein